MCAEYLGDNDDDEGYVREREQHWSGLRERKKEERSIPSIETMTCGGCAKIVKWSSASATAHWTLLAGVQYPYLFFSAVQFPTTHNK